MLKLETFRKKQKIRWHYFKTSSLLKFTKKELALIWGKTIGVVILLNYFFYQSIWAFLPLCIIGIFYFRKESRELLQKKKEQVREQFKELLLLTVTFQKAGYSIENAFGDSYQDMEKLFGKNCVICQILKRFATGRRNHRSFGEVWSEVGEELRIGEIKEFAEIYEIAYHHSGNISSVMEQTSHMMIQKAELQREIYLSLVERRMEMKIMTLMPFLIIQYIRITSPGYFQQMYHTPFGIAVMTMACLMYLMAYIWTMKIIHSEESKFE